MTKKEIKDILKQKGFTVITPSWYFGKPEEQSVLVNVYDEYGNPHQFYIDWGKRHARAQMYSLYGVELDSFDTSYMFFKEGRA